ncbi:LPS-assembly protein LptD [Candidatus Protochlamydia phocaeensis]|uniref:LPS-assembly protein LptD n=1 Tax=Candidatus Protochlamydia phocaeensis TaxID=1414722 RepID=UPI000839204D|nr:hypothetical protein [Candidatus Protochlamydia phocaeensis]
MTKKHFLPSFYSLLISLGIILFTLFHALCSAQEIAKLMEEGFAEGITVDLREPLYSDGVLTTEKGGVITAPHLRIQALNLRYTRKVVDNQPVLTIEAEDQLILEFGDYVFVGKKLFYDFQKKEGVIFEGRTAAEPWFFGGEKIELHPDGSYLIYEGYVTTSEKDIPEWGIYSHRVLVEKEKYLKANQVQIRLHRYPILWIPSLTANLDSIFDSPIKYRFRWGGRQGPRFGLTYEIFSWERWKTFVRFDYRLTRGPGGGIETRYRSLDHKTEFQSINYLAKDSSLLDTHEKCRFRFEGMFKTRFDNDKTNVLLTYDKISDRDMPSSYYDRDFDFDTSERTQLLIRHQEEHWIGSFYSRVRVNGFQTVKQELPTLNLSLKPLDIPQTGIIFENWANVSYLNFKYSKHLIDVHDYDSTRIEYQPTLYRPFPIGPMTFTPEVGAVSIFYGNSPCHQSQWLALGMIGCNARTQLYRYYKNIKHVIEPYSSYRYYSSPTSSPKEHYIFDISDGWTRLNMLTFGVKNSLYAKKADSCASRVFFSNIYAHAFFDEKTFRQSIPRVYSQFIFSSLPTVKHTLNMAWNIEHHQLDYFNFRSEWTLSADFALAAEYRHRSAYSWRKVDPENFFLDVYRKEGVLRHSPLSDRRDTLLVHFFYRFHPNWACEFSSRQGWNRWREPSYLEYEIDLLTTLQTAWHLKLSFQHQENDNRLVMYVNVGLKRPDENYSERKSFCYD